MATGMMMPGAGPGTGTLAVTAACDGHTAFRVDRVPFSGLHESGPGTGGIPYTREDMTVEKMLVVQSAGL